MNNKLSLADWKANDVLRSELLELINAPVFAKAVDTLIYNSVSSVLPASIEEAAMRRAWHIGYTTFAKALVALTEDPRQRSAVPYDEGLPFLVDKTEGLKQE